MPSEPASAAVLGAGPRRRLPQAVRAPCERRRAGLARGAAPWDNGAAVYSRVWRVPEVCSVLLAIWLSACTLLPPVEPTGPGDPTPLATPSPTAFQPLEPTSAPLEWALWVSPAVPRTLLEAVEQAVAESSGRFRVSETAEAADVRIEPYPERPLARWIYAVVAPFPSLQEGLGFGDLQARWASGGQESILVAPEVAALLNSVLNAPPGDHVQIVPSGELLDRAWETRPALAVVPFEMLEPRWKVLSLDGASPIWRSFDPASYALAVPFGISGDPEGGEALAKLLDWPASNRDPGRMTVVVMTGVTALTRATAWRMERKGLAYPAARIGDWLREADWTHISNEVSFMQTCPYPDPTQEGLKFCARPEYIALLETIGTDIVELTGNHGKDFGPEPFLETLEAYQSRGWLTFGGGANLARAYEPARIEHNGNKIAFLGCNWAGPKYAWAGTDEPGSAPCDYELLFQEVRDLRDAGYLPIFTFQWAELSKPSSEQQEAFRAAAEAGAVIVSGSQAHQPQGLEFHAGALIHYGLGNLFFDQMQSLPLRQEFIDRHIFYDDRHISTELLTAMLEDYAQPRPMTPPERTALLERIFAASGW